jgi:sulfite reductase (ferredoxin)
MNQFFLDLRGVACPMNFVKTKLFIDKMPAGETMEVFLDPGEPVESVVSSIQAEGHTVTECLSQSEGYFRVLIKKT